MSLPILTTTEDIDSIIAYLRNKPAGASVKDARAVIKETMDPRKISAFIHWGIISKDGENLKLAPRGWELARKPKDKVKIIQEILDTIVPYRSALEWFYHQKLDSITNSDVAAHWIDHHSESLGSNNENTIKDQAVCFFRLAESAQLGKLVIGRRGAATRFNIQKDQLTKVIESGVSAFPVANPPPEMVAEIEGDGNDQSIQTPPADQPLDTPSDGGIKLRVFITHGQNLELVEQVEQILEFSEIDYEVAIKEETTAIPVPEKIFSAMRRCNAGVIIVSKDQAHMDSTITNINPNVLIEIGAAFVLYDRRVVLLWEKGMSVPSNLQGLYRCEFDGNQLGWADAMKLMKGIKEFRR